MKIIIRTDASIKIGSGHVMRCLTLADIFRMKGHNVYFCMKPYVGNLIDYVEKRGYANLTELEETDLLLFDHYQIDLREEKNSRKYAKKIMVIDDLANRMHDCDILLDQNLVRNYETRYDDLVPSTCKTLLGPEYLILRDEFVIGREHRIARLEQVEKLLIFMGGTDPTNETMKVLEALKNVKFKKIHVVCGNGNPKNKQIQSICLKEGYVYHQQISYMAQLMSEVDFVVGAGGMTTWERCYVGVPSSSTIIADNQRETTTYMEELGAVINLGWHMQVTSDTYKKLLYEIKTNPKKLKLINEKGLQLTKIDEQPYSWIDEILEMIK